MLCRLLTSAYLLKRLNCSEIKSSSCVENKISMILNPAQRRLAGQDDSTNCLPESECDMFTQYNISSIPRKNENLPVTEIARAQVIAGEFVTSLTETDLATASSSSNDTDIVNQTVEYSDNDDLDSGSPSRPSKKRLLKTKLRAGALYKRIKTYKLSKINSKYFSCPRTQKVHKRWVPPRSPYALIQEDLFDKPWQLLVATVFLQKTQAKRALSQLHKFLSRFPRPEDVLLARYEDIDEYFKPLGLTATRSHIIMRFTVEYLEKDWTYPRELFGIGKYGDDSYRMFCINEWRQVSPDDIPLTLYRNWLMEHAQQLKLD